MGSSAVSAGRLRSVATITLSRTAAGSPATRSRICFLQDSHMYGFGPRSWRSYSCALNSPVIKHLGHVEQSVFPAGPAHAPQMGNHRDSGHF